MTRLVLDVTEDTPDFRSSTVSCRFNALNLSSTPVEVRSIGLRVPADVHVLEVRNPASLRALPTSEQICARLERILAAQIALVAQDDIISLTQGPGTLVGKLLRSILLAPITWIINTWRVAKLKWRIADGGEALASAFVRGAATSSSGIVPEIHCLGDAKNAYDTFFSPDLRDPVNADGSSDTASETITRDRAKRIQRKLRPRRSQRSFLLHLSFQNLMSLLEASETTASEGTSSLHPTLDSESEISQTFVMNCKRGWINTRFYTLTFEIGYVPRIADSVRALNPSSQPLNLSSNERTTTIRITPNPVGVSLIAIAGGAMGTLLRASSGKSGHSDSTAIGWHVLVEPAGITALILAFAFFNLFEFTALGERFARATSWRGALLIGLLCGLSGSLFLDTFQTMSR